MRPSAFVIPRATARQPSPSCSSNATATPEAGRPIDVSNTWLVIIIGQSFLPSAFYLLPSTFYLLPSTFCLLPSAFYLLPSTFCLLPSAFYLLPSTFRHPPSPLRREAATAS